MGESSILWLRVATGLYSLGLLDAIITVLRRREQLFRVALASFGLGALFHLVSLVEQGLLQHHLPVNDIFETTSVCAFAITISFFVVYWRYKTESLSIFVFPLVFVLTLIAALRNPVSGWSSEALRNGWLSVHIVLILLGYAALLFTAVAATAYLLQERELKRKRKRAQSVYRILPPLGTLDELISKSLAAGFTFITAGIIVGSIWAFVEHGTHWIGDSRITISFVTWAIYLALVFVRVSAGWRGRKTAILAIIALFCSAVTWVAHANLGSRLV
jgi:ABC-type transport system involved in cytochrome c biogenesis permease subunit